MCRAHHFHARAQGGFLIIEVAIAFLLVSIAIIGIMMLTVKGSRNSQENAERADAVNLASQIITKVRSSGTGVLAWNNVDVADAATWPSANAGTISALNELNALATGRLNTPKVKVVLSAPDGSACVATPCEVKVDVQWQGATRYPRSYSLSGWAGLQ